MTVRVLVWVALCLLGGFVIAWVISPITALLTGTDPKTEFRIIIGAYTIALVVGLIAATIKRHRHAR